MTALHIKLKINKDISLSILEYGKLCEKRNLEILCAHVLLYSRLSVAKGDYFYCIWDCNTNGNLCLLTFVLHVWI